MHRLRGVKRNNLCGLVLLVFGLVDLAEVKSVVKMSQVTKIRDGLNADGPNFLLNNKPHRVFSGAMHYFRIPREYWMDRLMKLKACGLNTVETYVAWNKHEPQPGVFDFSDNLDIVAYIQMATSLGINVIFRPGPYICAEWEWGGHPYWLLKDPNMKVRTTYPGYKSAVERFFGKLIPMVAPLQYQYGGGVVAVQVENEYGAYGNDTLYLQWMADLLTSNGIVELLFTSDGRYWLEAGNLPGTLKVINFQSEPAEELGILETFQPNKPLMVGEFWSGWFDHWGEKHHVLKAENYECLLKTILDMGASFNLYMFHGGTSFGFMNGANRLYNNSLPGVGSQGAPMLYPDVSSYDYDGPLSESGLLTEKYFVTQRLMLQYNPDFQLTPELEMVTKLATQPPGSVPLPGSILVESYIPLTTIMSMMTAKQVELNPLQNPPTNMEQFDQGYGFIAYRIQLPATAGKFELATQVADRLIVVAGGKVVYTGRPSSEFAILTVRLDIPTDVTDIVLLVENFGRNNYETSPHTLDGERKGIMNPKITFNGNLITNLLVYNLEMDKAFMQKLMSSPNWSEFIPSSPPEQPALYKMTFTGVPTDVYINTRGWQKGNVFINGFNLGRYLFMGPPQALYLPAPYMNTNGLNQLLFFELGTPGPTAAVTAHPDLGPECPMPCHVFGDEPYCAASDSYNQEKINSFK